MTQYSRKNIYLADDDEDDRILFTEAVEELNLDVSVRTACDGLELLNALKDGSEPVPEMIFLDINMPGKSGFECLKEIRNIFEEPAKMKVIMLSTSSTPANIELSYELGADLYAVKPSNFQALKGLLLNIMSTDWSSARKSIAEFRIA